MKFRLLRYCFSRLIVLAMAPGLASAVEPDERLDDPVLEERAREISQQLRCVVCQNQSIDDSDAPLARDLRLIIRERLVAGDDDRAVVAFVVARYGDFVLLKPPFQTDTYFLWVGPFIFVLFGLLLVYYYFRKVLVKVPGKDDGEES